MWRMESLFGFVIYFWVGVRKSSAQYRRMKGLCGSSQQCGALVVMRHSHGAIRAFKRVGISNSER
jgi:hypothetical protein